ncbi:hypothetical protein ISCGN_017040 [Ixodes scapularis]
MRVLRLKLASFVVVVAGLGGRRASRSSLNIYFAFSRRWPVNGSTCVCVFVGCENGRVCNLACSFDAISGKKRELSLARFSRPSPLATFAAVFFFGRACLFVCCCGCASVHYVTRVTVM